MKSKYNQTSVMSSLRYFRSSIAAFRKKCLRISRKLVEQANAILLFLFNFLLLITTIISGGSYIGATGAGSH